MKRFGFLAGALVLSALGFSACSGDDSRGTPASGDDAAEDSGTPGVDAGLPGDDVAVDANRPVDGADATVVVDAGVDASVSAESGTGASPPRDGGADSAPGEAGTADGGLDGGASGPSYALFVGTDFASGELAVVALYPDSVAGRLPLADQDSVPYASGGTGFVIEHALGKVVALDHAQPWTVKATIDINDSPDAGAQYAANPRAVLVTAGTKAYVARYSSNVVKIVDVASGAVTGNLDLSAFMAPDDTDGLVDVQDATYDAATGRAYFLLQRINQFAFGPAPDYVAPCLASHAEIVGVDVTSDAIVDLNGAAAGDAIDLLGDNPPSLTPDFAHGRLIVPETGCYSPIAADAGDAGTPPRLGRGVESVALSTGTPTTGTPTWLYRTGELERLNGIVWVDETHAFVHEGSTWFAWNPVLTTLGSAIGNFPQAPVYDGAARIVGLSFKAPAAGSDAGIVWSVVALDLESLQLSTIAASPFQSVVPDTGGFGVTSALLR